LNLLGFGQENYTSRKGSKFFPGHLDISITIDKNELRYELLIIGILVLMQNLDRLQLNLIL